MSGPAPPAEAPAPETTEDALLGGRLRLLQPRRGHRAGTDAMLLIAACGEGARAVDLGSGPGPIGLGLLALGRFREAVLVERDPAAAALARANIALNGLEARAALVEADLTARAALLEPLGLRAGMADLAVANPPYNEPSRHRASPRAARAQAHEMAPELAQAWLKAALRLLTANGRLALIHRPEALPWLLPLIAARMGAVTILPVHARAGEPASRVLIGARAQTKAPARILPALVLHEDDGRFTPLGRSIHAGEAAIALW